MFIRACLSLVFNTILVLFVALVPTISHPDSITLAVQYDEPEINDGFCIGAILNVFQPDSSRIVYEFGSDRQMQLELDDVGLYTFTAQCVIYDEATGEIAKFADGEEAISDESEPVVYEVVPVIEHVEPVGNLELENDTQDEPGSGEESDGYGVVGKSFGVGLSGCFILSLI